MNIHSGDVHSSNLTESDGIDCIVHLGEVTILHNSSIVMLKYLGDASQDLRILNFFLGALGCYEIFLRGERQFDCRETAMMHKPTASVSFYLRFLFQEICF